MGQHFISFYSRLILRCMRTPHIVYPFIVDGRLGCFHLLAVVSSAAMTMDRRGGGQTQVLFRHSKGIPDVGEHVEVYLFKHLFSIILSSGMLFPPSSHPDLNSYPMGVRKVASRWDLLRLPRPTPDSCHPPLPRSHRRHPSLWACAQQSHTRSLAQGNNCSHTVNTCQCTGAWLLTLYLR